MKKLCVLFLLLAISPGWLKSQSVVTAPDGKSWTLKTRNSLYRIAGIDGTFGAYKSRIFKVIKQE